MPDSTTATAEGITITRTFDAPRQLVWQAWTEPARFAKWYGGPTVEVPVETTSLDVRPGGEWRLVMLLPPDRTELPFWGDYREVVPPERLVFTITDTEGPERDVVTVELTALDDGRTEMLFTQTGGGLSEQEYGQAASGWGGFFDALAEHLAA